MENIIEELSKRLKKSTSVLIVDENDENFKKLTNGHGKVEIARKIIDENGNLIVKNKYGLILLGQEYLTPRVDLMKRIQVLMYRLTASGRIILLGKGNKDVVEKVLKLSNFVEVEQIIETGEKTYYVLKRIKRESAGDFTLVSKIIKAKIEFENSDDYDLGFDLDTLLTRLDITKEQFETRYIDFTNYKFESILEEVSTYNENGYGRSINPVEFVDLVRQYMGAKYVDEGTDYVNAQFETGIMDKTLLTSQNKVNFETNVFNTLSESIESHDAFKPFNMKNTHLDKLDEIYFSFTPDKRSILFPEAKGNPEVELTRSNMSIYNQEQIELMYTSLTNALTECIENYEECEVKDFIRLIFDYQKVIRYFKIDIEYKSKFEADEVLENIKRLLTLILTSADEGFVYPFIDEYMNVLIDNLISEFVGFYELTDQVEDLENVTEELQLIPSITDFDSYFKGKLKLSTKILNLTDTKFSSKVDGKYSEQQIIISRDSSGGTSIDNLDKFDYIYADVNYIYPNIDMRRICYNINSNVKLDGEIIFKIRNHDMNNIAILNSVLSIISYSLIQILQDSNNDYYIVLKMERLEEELKAIDLATPIYLQQSFIDDYEDIKNLNNLSELYDYYLTDDEVCMMLTDYQSYEQYMALMILLKMRSKTVNQNFFYPVALVNELKEVISKDKLDIALDYLAYYENFQFDFPIVYDESLRQNHKGQIESYKLMLAGKITNQREYIQNMIATTSNENKDSELITFEQFELQVTQLFNDSLANIKRKIGSNQNGYVKQSRIQKSLHLDDDQLKDALNQFKKFFSITLMSHGPVDFIQNYDQFTKVIYDYRSLFKILYNQNNMTFSLSESSEDMTEEEIISAHIEDIILSYFLSINGGQQIFSESGNLGDKIYHAINNAKSSRYIKNQFMDIKEMVEANIINSLEGYLQDED